MKKKFKIVCLMLVVVMMVSIMSSAVMAVEEVEEECIHYWVFAGSFAKTHGPTSAHCSHTCWTNYYYCMFCMADNTTYCNSIYDATVHSWTSPVGGWQACRNCGLNRPAP